MSQFEQWFHRAIASGETSPISLGMSPDQVKNVLGEPMNTAAPQDDPGTIMMLFYQCQEGAMQFDFTRQDLMSPCAGEQLRAFEEIGSQKRIVSKRTFL